MQTKRQKQNQLLTQLINQYQFKPSGHYEDLYVSQRTGAVLYRSGGVLEIDFGFDEQVPIHTVTFGKPGAIKNLFLWLRRIRSQLQKHIRIFQHLSSNGQN